MSGRKIAPRRKRRMAKTARRKDFNFLNGNTFSLGLGGKKRLQNKIYRAARKQVSVPVAKGLKIMTTPPLIVTSFNKTAVKHTEYVMDVDGTSDFEGTAMVINPGNGQLFPWLATIAQRFQSYKFRKLIFRYVTTSPTTNGGSVILTVDYDSNSTLPTNKQQSLAMESAVRTQPWENINHVSKAHNLRKRTSYFIRNGTDDVVDSELYDVGTVMIMTEGQPTEFVGGSVGELHVDYEVDLETPILTGPTNSASGASVVLTYVSNDSPPNFARPYINTFQLSPVDAPFSVTGVLTANYKFAGPSTAFVVDAINFMQPGLYLIVFEMDIASTSGSPAPSPADLAWYDSGYATTGLVSSRTVVQNWYTTDAATGRNTTVFLYQANGSGTINGSFGTFGFGWGTTTTTVTLLSGSIIITPISVATGIGPSLPAAKHQMKSRIKTLHPHPEISTHSNCGKTKQKPVELEKNQLQSQSAGRPLDKVEDLNKRIKFLEKYLQAMEIEETE